MENIQIYPAKVRVVPNVKLVKSITKFDAEDYQELLGGEEAEVVEKRNHKKFGMIATTYKIANAEGFTDENPLTEFDAAVLSACISEQKAGNDDTTPAVILRALTGKVGEGGDHKMRTNQRRAILDSVEKLMCTKITADLSAVNKALGYETTDASKKCSAILPAYFVEKTVNGQDATVIYFDRVSPIMTIAEQRSQILRFDASLLDVPNQNNTPRVITIKNCIMNRVMEIKLHKMTPTITFDDLFRKCRITDASRKTKMDARETAKIFFEHLKSKGVINSFEIVKNGNCQFHGIF